MFRFWASESRGCDRTTEATAQGYPSPSTDYFSAVRDTYHASGASATMAVAAPADPPRFLKRKRSVDADTMPPSPSTELDPPAEQLARHSATKRIKSESEEDAWPRAAFGAGCRSNSCGMPRERGRLASPLSPPLSVSSSSADAARLEQVKDTVQHHFGLEILVKHNELRLIDQELAKCQIALEQLRRCHLIPYPVACPTPAQMLDVASGRGSAVRPRPGAAVPKWAAPFGVVDGPYARHYAKWLIPDPVFDGPLPNWPGFAPPARSKSATTADARATRNSVPDTGKGRPTRGLAGQKLHSLSSGYPQPKDKAGPCVLKRADGKVVKLVCIDCHRENFSSTQGFINHCRIAHKRDFKSHEEAAVHCGHPIDADTASPPSKAVATTAPATTAPAAPTTVVTSSVGLPNASATTAVTVTTSGVFPTSTCATPGHVHALARSDNETANTILQHIKASYKSYSQVLPAGSDTPQSELIKSERASVEPSSAPFVASNKTPFLSRYLEKKQFAGSLDACVEDAREVVDMDDGLWTADEGYEDAFDSPTTATPAAASAKRVPTRPTQSPAAFVSNLERNESVLRNSSKGPNPVQLSLDSHGIAPSTFKFVDSVSLGSEASVYVDDDMDVDMSPNTSTSNNAPSLVSDDGEYDDSDDGSASETSDTDLDSVSDVAEINMDEDEDQAHDTPRPLRHHRGGVKVKKDEPKHVTFVSPVRGSNNGRRN